MNESTKAVFDVVFQGIQVAVVLATAAWAYIRFRVEGPLHPRIQFGISCKFMGPHHHAYVASFTISASNKGNVMHVFKDIRLKVLGIRQDDTLEEFAQYPPMLRFPVELMRGVNIIPANLAYYFVRPGVDQAFNYTTQIPADIKFIIVRATFAYKHADEIHSAQEVFEVKA